MNPRVSRLEYIGLQVTDLAAWEAFAATVLGTSVSRANHPDVSFLRMDQRHHRISVQAGATDDLAHLGWQVDSEAALEALAGRLEATGVDVAWASGEEAANRGAARLFRVVDPAGLAAEVAFGSPSATRAPSAAPAHPFVTGEQGVGHVAIFAPDPEATIRFYVEGLGLALSDTIALDLGPAGRGRATFLHAGPRHHALAIIPMAAPTRLHHLMLQLENLDDVGRTYDRCVEGDVPIELGLGRHTNDRMTSFYMRSPAGFLVEVGCGGRTIDDDTWEVTHYDRPSLWGHRPPPGAETAGA